MAQVVLKFLFNYLDEYNAFCATNGVTVDAGALPPVTAEPTLVEHDPVADGSVEAEPDPAPAAPAAAEETPPAEPEPPVEAPAEPAADASPATLDDAMAAGGRLVEACGNSNVEALAILKSMGFSRVSAMETPEQFAEFIRRCDEAVAAKGAGSLL